MALTDNLTAYWKLYEAPGVCQDSVGASHLTDNNTVGSVAGKQGNAAQFTAANSEYLSLADNAAVSRTGDFTIACWVYLDSKPSTAPSIVSKFNGTNATSEYALIYQGSAADRFALNTYGAAGEGTAVTANSSGAPSLATWYFIVGWWNDAADTFHIQVNNGTVDNGNWTPAPNDTTTEFRIGTRVGSTAYWNGRIDEVGIWKRVLTAAERSALYNGGAGVTHPFTYSVAWQATSTFTVTASVVINGSVAWAPASPLLTNLTSYWKLEEASGTRSDSHGPAHLTDNNTVTQTPGKVGNAALFVHTNAEFLSVVDASAPQFSTLPWTFSLWVKFTDNTSWQPIFTKRIDSTNQREMQLWLVNGARIEVQLSATGATGGVDGGSGFGGTLVVLGSAPTVGQWYHIVAWYDGSTLRGQLDGGTVQSTSWTNGVFNSTAPLILGSNGHQDSYLKGALDEVGVWTRILTADERTALYNGGAGITYPLGTGTSGQWSVTASIVIPGSVAWPASSTFAVTSVVRVVGTVAWVAGSSFAASSIVQVTGIAAWPANSTFTVTGLVRLSSTVTWVADSTFTVGFAVVAAGSVSWTGSSTFTVASVVHITGTVAWPASSAFTVGFSVRVVGTVAWTATSTWAVTGQAFTGVAVLWTATSAWAVQPTVVLPTATLAWEADSTWAVTATAGLTASVAFTATSAWTVTPGFMLTGTVAWPATTTWAVDGGVALPGTVAWVTSAAWQVTGGFRLTGTITWVAASTWTVSGQLRFAGVIAWTPTSTWVVAVTLIQPTWAGAVIWAVQARWFVIAISVPPREPPVPVGFYLPDRGQEYILAEMEEDKERARGLPTRTERPGMPVAAGDWGQEIMRRRMEEDEDW